MDQFIDTFNGSHEKEDSASDKSLDYSYLQQWWWWWRLWWQWSRTSGITPPLLPSIRIFCSHWIRIMPLSRTLSRDRFDVFFAYRLIKFEGSFLTFTVNGAQWDCSLKLREMSKYEMGINSIQFCNRYFIWVWPFSDDIDDHHSVNECHIVG